MELDYIKVNKLLTTKNGHQITLHDPGEIPIPEKSGFDIPWDSMADVIVSPAVYTRLGYPWGSCHGSSWKYHKNYTTAGCQIMCKENYIRRNYHCYDYISDLENITQVLSDYKPCSQVMPKDFSRFFVVSTGKSFVRGIECDCPKSCSETVYKYKIHGTTTDGQTLYALRGVRDFVINRFKERQQKNLHSFFIRTWPIKHMKAFFSKKLST